MSSEQSPPGSARRVHGIPETRALGGAGHLLSACADKALSSRGIATIACADDVVSNESSSLDDVQLANPLHTAAAHDSAGSPAVPSFQMSHMQLLATMRPDGPHRQVCTVLFCHT
jgi:hypothetical protein